MHKNELQKDMKVKTTWKGKKYIGCIIGIPKEESQKSAKITHGRFISIPIIADDGRILQMPYTNKALYERI